MSSVGTIRPERLAFVVQRFQFDDFPSIATGGLPRKKASLQVVHVGSVPDNNYRTIFFQPVVRRAGEPLPRFLANVLAASVGHRRERIIDEQNVRASTVQAAADAHCVVRTALLCVPTSSRLAIFRQAHIEHLAILFAAHQIADVSAELFR